MDDETRAAFARMDRWFELSQEQFVSFRDEVRGELAALGSRMDRLEQRVDSLQQEMRERFVSVDEQLRSARASDALLHERLAEVRDQSTRQGERLDRVEFGIAEMNNRVDSLADEMRQRFRVVNERLGSAA